MSPTTPSLPDVGDIIPSALNFPVVGIGASAGGLSALLRFFQHLPADNGMAFVVILHLSPQHPSDVDTLLQGVTKMPVVQVKGSTSIEAGHVYVISPTKHLSMNDGYLSVEEQHRPHGRHVAVDLFFRSLALVHRDRAFAIVLSGTGSDGAGGIARIKEQGGVTLAQLPEDAEFDGMPRAAIATGAVDWVLPVVEMPQKLIEIWGNARRIQLPEVKDEENAVPQTHTQLSASAQKESDEALRDIMLTMRTRTGHDFRHYKRATVLRRLERRLQVNALPHLPAYRAFLNKQPEEAPALLKDLLIGVTNFFRDREAFEALEREVLPSLFDRTLGHDMVRAWVPGCASGEEAYSIAMLLHEHAALHSSPREVQIFATDIDEQAIAIARSGAYPESIVTDVPPTRLRHFFQKEAHQYRIRKEVREKVLFAAHNILRAPPFSRLDLISCRNLLIYLDREIHPQILEMFHFALRPGGYLFLGSSESADAASQLFSVVDKKNRIYRANAVPHAARYTTSVPARTFETPPLPGRETGVERRKVTYAEIHQRLAEQYAPPSVLMDADSNIVHLSEQAGRFLRYAAGTPSHHLLTLVRPELRLELRTALYQALQTGKSVEARRVRLGDENQRTRYVNMVVRPVQEPSAGGQLVMVVFAEAEDSLANDAAAPDAQGRDPLIMQLEEELKRTKEQLQNTIEQSESSTEELKASNEELQAINEELRSTTEELETSKEELQSINEELITVNHELKTKVEETGKINDDLQNLIASTDIATVFIDRGMAIKRYTPRATQIFSIIPSDVGRSLLDIRHRLDYETLADDATEAFQSLRQIEREVSSSDGKWYLARLLPYRTTEDRIDGAVLTFIDITTRRQAEESMRLVAESTKDYAIITMDLEGRITTWNKGAERIFGYPDSEVVGKSLSFLFGQDDDAPPEGLQGELRRAREQGRAEDDRWHLRMDGMRIFCSGIVTPLYRDGELQGYAKIARDLTGSKNLEGEREALLRRETSGRAVAQMSSDLKDEFLAVLSHELKNPLNLIQMNAELLTRLPGAREVPAVVQAAETIHRTVLSQAQIIDDLLDLSRLNTGKLTLRRTQVDFLAIVQRIAEAVAADALAKQLDIQLELPEQPLLLHADPVRLEQITWNLVSNAVKFTPSGGQVVLRLGLVEGEARLEVVDNGRGIEPEFLPKVFDMFQQAESRSIRHEGGLGIGLALVKQLVGLHGGRVEARSLGTGHGTTFVVCLPTGPDEHCAKPQGGPGQQGGLEGVRVLLVDDERQTAETLRRLLGMEGIDVKMASSAPEALALCEKESFDVIVSDIAMPGMDGYQLVERLVAMPRHAQTRKIAVSGFGRPSDVQRALATGFHAHLSKPVTLEQLLRSLHQVLQETTPDSAG
ncbi:PAS domain S-box protein [Aquabacterium sp. A7-Y]|uniref:CheR family methyltransferase n=1 Tax=Aquabacterium sp. A7-Y TaxID=1349605 RepID=UPI00223E2525|nr:CheR family methyltransferase [Aquabacterium sp. A7-Y]MCW7539007.1 PAS domain S-box protein [Aquabacterium sp. A7-Y]